MTSELFQLRMEGMSGMAIPWTFVQVFAAKMKQMTQNGFRGSYTAFYKYSNARVSIVVFLATLAMVAAAA